MSWLTYYGLTGWPAPPLSRPAALGVEVHDAIKAAVRQFGGEDVPLEPLERFEFYDASREPRCHYCRCQYCHCHWPAVLLCEYHPAEYF